jgi:hypothetical protein
MMTGSEDGDIQNHVGCEDGGRQNHKKESEDSSKQTVKRKEE